VPASFGGRAGRFACGSRASGRAFGPGRLARRGGPGGRTAPTGGRFRLQVRVSYGYRRITVLLRREGWRVNAKRTYRLYREEGLGVRRKRPKRRRNAMARQVRRGSASPWRRSCSNDNRVT